MKIPTLLCLLFLALLLPLSPGKTVALGEGRSPNRSTPSTTARRPSLASENIFNFSDFGAVGDGVTDAGPALQNALDAIGESGGGTLLVPGGRYVIITPVEKDFTGLASVVSILGVESSTPVPPPTAMGTELSVGLNLISEFAPATGEAGIALSISGLQNLLIKDVTFIGSAEVDTDALITLRLDAIREAIIRHCEFYGLGSIVEGGAIVHAARSNLKIEQTVFLGSTCNSGVNTSVVQNVDWKGLTIADSLFVDYGQRPELFGKLGTAPPLSWVSIGNPAAVENDSPRREVVISNVFTDEGAVNGLLSLPQQSAPIDLFYISGLYANVSNLNASANYLSGLGNVLIEKSHYGWSHAASAAINLHNVNTAILDQVECLEAADRIIADSATNSLTVIDSVYNHLDSEAHNTRVLTTNSIAEDPVQYVRQQFMTTLNRDPDPAAHFYWSNRLLECGDFEECIADQRAALNAYLETAPSPNFSISGKVTDENDDGLASVLVTLGGSQSITTQTGVDGRFIFSELPTSGVYNVTPTLSNYTFNAPSRKIITPSSDQSVNFDALLIRHEITVQIVDINDHALADVTVSLSGLEEQSGTTDLSGHHVIGDVGAGGDYTITPTKQYYTFSPESVELNGLQADHVVTFTGAPLPNQIDEAQFFVRQHYRDFLNREADDDGLAFWANQISSCGTDAACVENRRINVSAAFFLSMEFQETGFLVYRVYQAAFARSPECVNEFQPDTRSIGQGVVVNAPGWQTLLETNKTLFLESFVARPQFIEAYPLALTPAEFVNQLNLTAGHALSADDINAAVAEFAGAATSEAVEARARVLRRLAENQSFSQRQLNPAFVLMQYFGYLQRNPSDPPDTSLDGYNFWLNKLNEFGGDFRRAEMVKSFLVAGEYRSRFGLQ